MKTSRAAAACLLIVLLGVPGASALLEDFESYTEPPFNPDRAEWTYLDTRGSDSIVTTTEAHNGDRSFMVGVGEDVNQPEHVTFEWIEPLSLCQDGVSFAMKVGEHPTGGSVHVGLTPSGEVLNNEIQTARSAWLNIGTSGVSFQATGGTSTQMGVETFGSLGNVSEWREYTISCHLDAEVEPGEPWQWFVRAQEANSGWFAQTTASTTAWNSTTEPSAFSIAGGDWSGTATLFLDDLQFGPAASSGGTQSFDAEATYSTTNLVGFDVDVLGQNVITRETTPGTGSDVKVLSGSTLTLGGSTATGCTQTKGVAALPTAVSYLKCDAGGTTTHFHVKSPGLATPDWPSQCDAYCVDEIPVTELEGDSSNYHALSDVKAWPFDFSASQEENQLDRTYMAWAFTENVAGRVGSVTLTQINNADDNSQVVTRTLDPTASPQVNQMCTARVADQDYVIATTENGATNVYEVGFNKDFIGVPPAILPTLEVTMGLKAGGAAPSTALNGQGIACSEQPRYIVTTIADKVAVVDYSGSQSQVVWSKDVVGATEGVAMSYDGAYVAYVDQTLDAVVIANATTGETEATVNTTGADYSKLEGLRLDYNAQNLWVAFDDGVSRFEVWPATTGSPVGPGQVDPGDFGGDPVEEGPEGSLFGGLATDGSGLLGATGNQLFAAGLLVFGFMSVGAGAFGVGEKRKGGGGVEVAAGATLGGSIGAAFGVVMAVATELVPKEWAFVLALFLALAIGGWFFLRRG